MAPKNHQVLPSSRCHAPVDVSVSSKTLYWDQFRRLAVRDRPREIAPNNGRQGYGSGTSDGHFLADPKSRVRVWTSPVVALR